MMHCSSSKEMKSTGNRRQMLFYIGVVMLLISIGFVIAWSNQGTNVENFTGIGQAEILNITKERVKSSRKEIADTRYTIDVRVTAGGDTIISQQTLSSNHRWKRDDIVPIVYNAADSSEFAMGTTPEGYAGGRRIIESLDWCHLLRERAASCREIK